MLDRRLLRALFVTFGVCMAPFAVVAQEEFEEYCCVTPSAFRAGVRHIEARGIGYDEGYTTLEAFVSPFSEMCNFVPILDLRGHIFNDGKFAANAGIGGRFWTGCQIFGFNGFYDFRKTHRKNYNQVGAGFEWIGTLFEARVNGYAAIGRRRTSRYHVGFKEFEGHHIFLKYKRQTSLQGADAEFGVRYDGLCNTNFFLGAGPYYLQGKSGAHTWGGQARLTARYREYFGVTVSTSYDSLFKNIVQGEIGFTIPFGPRKNRSCCSLPPIENRLVQPIIRHEIIPIATRNQRTLAINPATGLPYEVWFVDNTSSSNGTFESPFTTITAAMNASAPNDIIYIYPGNGQAYDSAVLLKDGQRIYGSANAHLLPTQFGNVVIPATQSPMPLVTNSLGDVITLANNNEVSGLHIVPTNVDRGIFGGGVTNGNINQNALTTGTGQKIVLSGVNGTFFINENLFSAANSALDSMTIDGNTNADFMIRNNQIYTGSNGIVIVVSGGNSRYDIAENIIQAPGISILAAPTGSSHLSVNITRNVTSSSLGLVLTPSSPSTIVSNISHNAIDGVIGILGAGSGNQTALISNNQINAGVIGIQLQLSTSSGTMTSKVTISRNQIVADDVFAILIVPNGAGTGTVDLATCITHNHLTSPNPTVFVNPAGNTLLCLKYQHNIGLPESEVRLSAFSPSAIELEPYIFNNSTLTIVPGSTVVNVPDGTCGCCENCE